MRTGKLFGLAVLSAAGVGSLFLTAGAASANGCNGVVSQLEWGCAAWDNNNGPQYPHYRQAGRPSSGGGSYRPAPSRPYSQPYNGNSGRIIHQDGAGVVGPAGGSIVSHDGGT